MKGLRLGLSLVGGGGGTLMLDFLSGSLDSRITFTRGSTGTYFNSSGVLSSAAINTPRFDYDPVTLAPKGLLIEEARTNLLTYSEQFDNAAWAKSDTTVTANSTTAPAGSATADKLVADATTTTHRASEIATTANGTSHTMSLYVKAAGYSRVGLREGNFSGAYASFNLATGVLIDQGTGGVGSIAAVGNGWFRISMTSTSGGATMRFDVFPLPDSYTTGSPNIAYTGDGTSGIYLYGAQLEAGAFATSYIPTVASTVTRSADGATMTGTNFSSWYNQSAGTFVPSSVAISVTSTGRVLSANDGTFNNSIAVLNGVGQIYTAGVSQCYIGTTPIAGAVAKQGLAYAANDAAYSQNGSAIVSDATVTLPTVNQLAIGAASPGTAPFSGHIRSIAYFNTRLPDAQLQALTA